MSFITLRCAWSAPLVAILLMVSFNRAAADGTETLGPPSIPIAQGTGVVAAGVGLAPGTPAVPTTGTLTIEVPAGALVQQVLLYWEGFMATNAAGPNTIDVNGVSVTGTRIGGPAFFFSGAYSSAYRADITGLGLVSAGSNSLTIASPGYTDVSNGAGVVVIYNDGSSLSDIALRDGVDLAFINFPEPRKSTIAQTFQFASASATRVANLAMFFSSVAGTISGADSERPSSVEVTVGDGTNVLATTILSNVLASLDGEEWDTLNLPIEIPAGATELTVQAFSQDNLNTGDLPASFAWTAAALSVPPVSAAIGDTVWQDLNTNGLQGEGEPGVIDVTVNLLANPDGDADCSSSDETLITSDVTDSGGKYLFDGLEAGNYCVEFVRPDGFVFTEQNVGPDDTIDSDANVVTGRTANIALDADETDLTWDAGLIEGEPVALGDYLWEDLNQNGIQDEPADAGINGQNVFLLDCDLSMVDSTTTADRDGNPAEPGYYLFDNLAPGCYIVEFTKPAGFVFTGKNVLGPPPVPNDSDADPGTARTEPIDLESGETDLTWDAGVYEPIEPELGDFVWEDLDGDGEQGPNEPGINGTTVELYDCDGTFITSTLTADDINGNAGYYLFTSPDVMVGGCYQVKFLEPADYCEGAQFTERQAPGIDPALDSDAPLSDQVNLTPPDDLVNLTVDAGVLCPAALGDYVWEDFDRNGVQDEDDTGINDVFVELLDCTGEPVLDAGGNPLTTTTFAGGPNDQSGDLNGYYEFTGLLPGCYVVRFTEPAGFIFSDPNQGGDDALDSDADLGTGQTGPIDLESGETDLTWDAGVYEPIEPELGDFVWEDLDGDGEQDPNEPGINGATVRLLDCTGQLIATTTTADDAGGNPGYYLFAAPDVMVGGCYQVEFELPVDFYCADAVFTERQAPGVDPVVDSDAPLSDQVNLLPPDDLVNRTIDAGVICPAGLGDYVWEDLNRDGIQNEPESAGVNGVTVELLDPGSDGLCDTGDELPADTGTTPNTTFTDDDTLGNPGYYQFFPLEPGLYCVQVAKPIGFACTLPNEGPAQPSPIDSDMIPTPPAVTYCQTKDLVEDPIELSSSEFDTSWDAGIYRPAALGDYVWNDLNADGIQNDGETGINGVTVRLQNCEGVELQTTTTGAGGPNDQSADVNGFYAFGDLAPGCYQVAFDTPAGFLVSPRQQGANPALDSDGPLSDPVTLVSGERNATIDSGFFQPRAALGDYVWEDLNADGIQNDGNTGINGVTVNLYTCTGALVGSTVTANDGAGNPGYYLFDGLVSGCYEVEFVNPDPVGDDAYMFSPQNQGGDNALDSDADPVTGRTGPIINLDPGETDLTWDAGLFRKGSIHVFGFLDIDGDGIQDSDEGAFPDDPGKTFELLDANGNVIDTQVTVSGSAGFVSLLPGTYTVQENPIPDGYSLTTLPNARTFTIVSGEELVYEPGAADLPQDDQRFETSLGDKLKWGNVELAALGDYVWEDRNADGIQNDGNTGINGVTVRLLSCAGVELRTTVTGAGGPNDQSADLNGYYEFTGLLPGCYQVEFVNLDPNGDDAYQYSPRQVGANPAVDSDGPVSDPVNLIAGERNPTIDAGLYRLGSIHVFGFLDVDGNGNQDIGEGAFPDDPGKTFELLDADGNVITTQTTVSGKAGFVSLLPGTYRVLENPIPDGYSLTTLPNERTFTIVSGQELVYEPGAAELPQDDQRFETVLGDELKWGNTLVPVCDVFVEKTCAILPPQVSEGTCEKPIDVLTLQYAAVEAGGKEIASVEWYAGDVGSSLIGTTGAIADGEIFDFVGFDGAPNDVQMLITFTDGSQLISEFHISCSDDEMDGPEDCGILIGDGKGDDLPDGKFWLFRGTDGPNGGITCALAITDPVFPTETELCEYTAEPEAASCDDLEPVTALTMVWDGPDGVTMTVDETGETITDIINGDVVRFGAADLPNDVTVTLTGSVTGASEFHISCSDDAMDGPEDCGANQGDGKGDDSSLINDFLFGGMTGENGEFGCPGVPAPSSAADVIYGYRVTNPNAEDIVAQIVDDKLGISQTETVAANDLLEIVVGPVSVLPDDGELFVNTVVVTAETASGASCEASDSVTVKRDEPLVPVSCSDIDPITAVSLVWEGDVPVDIVMESGERFENVLPGNQITFQEADTGNDVLMDIYIAGTTQLLGSSEFHVSCSDDAMDGTEDCGTNQGNGKGDDPSLINDWLLDGMTGEQGSFECGLPNTGVVDPAPLFITGADVADLKDLKKVKWDLTNNTFADAYITNLYVNWPAAHDQLKKVKLDGDEFAKDVFDSTPPTDLPAEDPFEADVDKRTLEAGATETLEIEFTVEVPFREQSDFEIVVDFSNGQTVTFNPVTGAVTGAASLDLSDSKKVKWDLTNNTFGDVFIESLTIDWPEQAGQELKKVKLDGDEFAKDVFDGTPPTNLPAEDPFETDIDKRTLEIGNTETLEIEFTENRVSNTGYSISVTFSNGDVVSIAVP